MSDQISTEHSAVAPAGAPRWVERWLTIAAVALIYVLTAKLGQLLAIPPGNVTPVWLPSGFILAAVLIRGPWVWPGIFIGAFVGNVSAYAEAGAAQPLFALAAGIGNGVGDVLCALVSAALLRRADASYPFRSVRQVFLLVLFGGLVGPLLSAVFGVTSLTLTGFVPSGQFLLTFMTWWTGDAVGVLLIAPLILSLRQQHRAIDARELIAFAAALTLTATALWLHDASLDPAAIAFALAFCIWSAFRFGDSVTFASVLVVTAAAIIAVVLDDQSTASLNRRLVQLQLFVASFAIAIYALRAALHERESAEERLRQVNADLDADVAERIRRLADQTAELEANQVRLRTLLDQLAAGVVVHAPDTRIKLVNAAAERILGLTAEEMVGRCATEESWHFVDAQGHPLALADYPVNQIVASAQPLTDFSMAVVNADRSTERSLLVNGRPMFDETGDLREIIISFFDVSALRLAEQRLRNAEAVFTSTSEGIIVTDADSRIIDVNPAFSVITGFQREDVLGQTPKVLQSGRHSPEFYAEIWRALAERGDWRGEIWNRRANGQVFPELLTISAVRGKGNEITGYIGVFYDNSALKAAETRLDQLAHHDALTGLPNRLLLRATLGHGISRARRFGSLMAVAFVDLDRFKQINDSLGHQSGDALLVEIAGRLRATVRDSDTVARVSGDEFVVVMEDLAQAIQARVGIEKLMEAFESPIDLAGKQVRVTASIGVALYPQDGDDPEQLIGNADTAMYSAKDEGRNTFRFFTVELTRLAQETAVLDTALKSARQQDEFTLVYQPQFDIATGALVSAEALLRWRRPGLGEVPPGRFIEVAEQNGLIAEIGHWVLLNACQQAARWLQMGIGLDRIAVNISGQQVRMEGFANEVLSILERTGLPARALELEVTEHVLMRQLEHSVQQLVMLQDRGVSIAIDDFGTGYSSLSYLKVLPIDSLKIDQSFVRDIEVDPDDQAIVESVIVLGKALRKSIVAEGVETEAQLAFLKQRGCDKAQGFLLGKPMPPADLEDLLRQRRAAATAGSADT